ncbi:MAG: UbiH/UbiF/VisC/COQ6 family ubiquinone biosynthesis hydroxylase [Pseudomonadales bacterium]|nr:UbiH/UbiF/VisC/COQ6 family ubiquinone biosynthesis hydroxylase [Pseudomonadales bacterium]
MSVLEQQKYDIVVVGAGMVGLACALACVSDFSDPGGDIPLKIAIIESQSEPAKWQPQKFDKRVSALTEASRQILDSLGAWDEIQQTRVSPYDKMHVWDGDGVGKVDFCAADIQQPVLGHIVENSLITTALLHQAEQHPQIELFYGSGVAELSKFDNHHRTLTLNNGQQFAAPLIVAADGALSTIRTLANISLKETAYNHNAIVTTVKTQKAHGCTAWQRFDETGPLAFLPLSKARVQPSSDDPDNHYCSIVWSVTPEKTAQLLALDDDQFRQALGTAFEYRLGEIEEVEPRFHFPLVQRHAEQYVQPGIVLVGDAAHTIHPLAGQGVNLGFLDAAVLAEELQRAVLADVAPGNLDILKRYQRRRRGDNQMMIYSMMGFKKLFEQSSLPVRWARNRGMDLFNQSGWLKNAVTSQAMRVNTKLPKIAQG